MKLPQLTEMTMRVSSYEELGAYIDQFADINVTGEFAGDLQHYQVYKRARDKFTDYAVFDKESIIAFFVLEQNELLNAYVKPEHRKQGVFSMFLFFLKRNEGFTKIIIGDLHSEATVEAIKHIAIRFHVYWTNGEIKVPYDPAKIDDFYSHLEPTEWQIVLENNGDFSRWPKKFDPLDSRTWYSPLLENIDV